MLYLHNDESPIGDDQLLLVLLIGRHSERDSCGSRVITVLGLSHDASSRVPEDGPHRVAVPRFYLCSSSLGSLSKLEGGSSPGYGMRSLCRIC